MSARRRLPSRRPSVTDEVTMVLPLIPVPVTVACFITVGFDPETGRALEIFARARKADSFIDYELDDAAVVISVALQYGVPVAELRKSVSGRPGAAASVVAYLLDHLSHTAPEPPAMADASQFAASGDAGKRDTAAGEPVRPALADAPLNMEPGAINYLPVDFFDPAYPGSELVGLWLARLKAWRGYAK